MWPHPHCRLSEKNKQRLRQLCVAGKKPLIRSYYTSVVEKSPLSHGPLAVDVAGDQTLATCWGCRAEERPDWGVLPGHSQPPEVPLRAAALQRCTAAWLPSGGWRGREGTSPLTAGGGFSSVTVLGRSLVLSVLNFLHATVVSHVQCALLLTYFI